MQSQTEIRGEQEMEWEGWGGKRLTRSDQTQERNYSGIKEWQSLSAAKQLSLVALAQPRDFCSAGEKVAQDEAALIVHQAAKQTPHPTPSSTGRYCFVCLTCCQTKNKTDRKTY
jgi:hypothetical protein